MTARSSFCYKSKPVNVESTSIYTTRDTIPGHLAREILDTLECHFNWELMGEHVIDLTIDERLSTVEGHLRENSEGTEPQTYTLLAYYKSMLKRKGIEGEETPIDCLDKAFNEIKVSDNIEGLGYKAVVLSNKVMCHSAHEEHTEARAAYDEYNKLKEQYKGNLNEHPEVLAMKAFALGFSQTFENAIRAIEAYTKALSHEMYKDRVWLLYGLYCAKSSASRRREKSKEEMEAIVRRIVNLDEKHGVAMGKLARLLVYNGAFEEADYWINKAINISPKKVTVYEEAASVYQIKIYREKNKGSIDKAIEWYKEAEKINNDSRNTIFGLGRCYMFKYRANDIKKKNKIVVPESLQNAPQYFEKGSNKRNFDQINLADVYEQLSKYKNHPKYKNHQDFLAKSKSIYEEIIKKSKQEQNSDQEAEAYYMYAVFLRKNYRNNQDKEIEYLKKAIAISSKRSVKEPEFYFIPKCQEFLLKYAAETDIMEEMQSLQIKSWIHEKRGHLQTAIFYLQTALENGPDQEMSEHLAELILEASTKEYATDNLLKEAMCIIEDLPDSSEKWNLETRAKEIEVYNSIGAIGNLNKLKKDCLILEKYETQRKNSKFIHPGIEVIFESRRILDRAMNLVKHEVYGIPHNTPPFTYYPSPKALSKFGGDLEQKMKRLLQSSKLNDFKEKLPRLFSLLVERQPPAIDYQWLQGFFEERNEIEHSSFYSKRIDAENLDMARKASKFAMEVWDEFEKEVKLYKHNISQ